LSNSKLMLCLIYLFESEDSCCCFQTFKDLLASFQTPSFLSERKSKNLYFNTQTYFLFFENLFHQTYFRKGAYFSRTVPFYLGVQKYKTLVYHPNFSTIIFKKNRRFSEMFFLKNYRFFLFADGKDSSMQFSSKFFL